MGHQQRNKSIDLALQGGGSHGAFTWGVLDRLLADGRIDIGGVSGASAGAMNAVVLAHGLRAGGREGARQALNDFWGDVGRAGGAPFQLSPFAALFQHWQISGSPLQRVHDVVSRLVSPYQLNPFNLNPLRETVERHVDFEALRATERPRLFVCATNVRTGHPRVFRNAELTRDAVLASACLPVLFQAIAIGEDHYWDGGYSRNPALLPLVAESDPSDLMLVQINPVERPGLPSQAHEIIDRINEISFNASLNQELQTLALIKEALREGRAGGEAYAASLFRRVEALHVHRIEAQKEMAGFGASSKLNPEWGFLERLHDIGHRAADRWLAAHFDDLGRRSTIDLLRDMARVTDLPRLAGTDGEP